MTNVAHATARDLACVDAVMYTVRGDHSEPFRNIYKYADVLHATDAVEAAAVVAGCESPRSAPTRAASSEDVVTAALKHLADAPLPAQSVDRTCSSLSLSMRSPPAAAGTDSPGEPSAESGTSAGAGAGAGAGSSGGERLGGPSPSPPTGQPLALPRVKHQPSVSADLPTPHGLRVQTGSPETARIGTSFRRRRRNVTPLANRRQSAPPMAVVVTMCDVLDASADTDPQALLRLRAMAANWSSANRMRVTFVSSQTGVGVNSAMAHLIKLAYVCMEARMRENEEGPGS